MTEESDADDGEVRQHKLPWLSTSKFIIVNYILENFFTEFIKLVKKLDKRAKESAKTGSFKSKIRLPSTPSTLLPPPDAPS